MFQQTWKVNLLHVLLPLQPPGLPGPVLLLHGGDAGQPALHQVEGLALGQQHQEAVHAGQQLVVSVQQLEQLVRSDLSLRDSEP